MDESTVRRTQRTHKKHIEIQENPKHLGELGKIKYCPNCGSLLKGNKCAKCGKIHVNI